MTGLENVSIIDQYVVQNLTWSRFYLSSTLLNSLLHQVLTLVILTDTIPKAYVTTMKTDISDSYNALENNVNHLKSRKLRSGPGENVADFCAAILVDAEILESSGAFNTKLLGYITHTTEGNYDCKFSIREIHNSN